MIDLKDLPPHPEEPRAAERGKRAARAAYERSFAPGSWLTPLGRVNAVVMPVVLAAFVGLYLTWAITSAAALLH